MATKAQGHGERHLVFYPDGSCHLHVRTDDGDFYSPIEERRALLLESVGVPVTVLGNGLLALGFPGCSLVPLKCVCRPLREVS